MSAMTATELLDDHQRHPRHLGKLPGASATGDVGSIVVGDALRLFIAVDAERRISEARFQVFGARGMIAATSMLCEMLPGQELEAAAQLGVQDIAAAFGDLDPLELPPLPWGLEALRAAVAQLTQTPLDADDDIERLVCRCHGITESMLIAAIEDDNVRELDALIAATAAGSGCGSCRNDIARLLEQVTAPPEASPSASPTSASSGRIPMMQRMQGLLAETQAASEWQSAGCRIELWDMHGNDIVVRLHGDADEAQRRRWLGLLEHQFQDHIAPEIHLTWFAD